MQDLVSLASQFINTTSSHIFLTGKAGTGKTTFLRNLQDHTHKRFIVVAPTGIAALNAGGTTIHSQFLIPPSTFVPDRSAEGAAGGLRITSPHILSRHHPLNQERKRVLRAIDLLVIDEVSMLRADLLDAIDSRLRSARGNFRQSFGGVQVLFIGDLFQLPPVVKREEWSLLSPHYNSPWFYEALALRERKLVYIEFDKIYRQHDDRFIGLLNHLRNNETTREDIDLLNERYLPAASISEEEIITLTTHNYKADEINQERLRALPAAPVTFDAHLEGEFPESMYPVLPTLVLKKGAQIMFVRNDSEDKMYFNGKLATVTEIDEDKHEVWVSMAETHVRYPLKRVRWENKKYKLNETTQELEEEVLGAFEQFPVKLAWAITVHKSQGLTFERAIIDVGQAFADGQVYVALSRLRSLEGLVLRTRVEPSVISTDRQIVEFVSRHHRPDALTSLMKEHQEEFVRQLFLDTFNFRDEIREIEYLQRDYVAGSEPGGEVPVLKQLETSLRGESVNTEKFTRQLLQLLAEGTRDSFLSRLQQGATYYKQQLLQLERLLLTEIESLKLQKGVKAYREKLTTFDVVLAQKVESLYKIVPLTEGIFRGERTFDFNPLLRQRQDEREMMLALLRQQIDAAPTKKRAPKKKKKPKGEDGDTRSTSEISRDLFKGGRTVAEIAAARSLTQGTIESHLVESVKDGTLSIHELVNGEALEEITQAWTAMEGEKGLKRLHEHFDKKFSYGLLRAALYHIESMARM